MTGGSEGKSTVTLTGVMVLPDRWAGMVQCGGVMVASEGVSVTGPIAGGPISLLGVGL